jgi:hypothetical protein
MIIASLCMLCLIAVVTVIVALTFRSRQNDKLAAMTDPELLGESFWAAQRGDYENIYSRELVRRQQPSRPGPDMDGEEYLAESGVSR